MANLTDKREIIDYSKWAGAGRGNAARGVYPSDDVVYCYIKQEILKRSAAAKISLDIQKSKKEKVSRICGDQCEFQCR